MIRNLNVVIYSGRKATPRAPTRRDETQSAEVESIRAQIDQLLQDGAIKWSAFQEEAAADAAFLEQLIADLNAAEAAAGMEPENPLDQAPRGSLTYFGL